MPPKSQKKGKKAGYMISAVAEMYDIHPQTLRLYEREGLLKPSRSEGNTRLYTEEDLDRLKFILNLTRDLGVNLCGRADCPEHARTDGRNGARDASLHGDGAQRNARPQRRIARANPERPRPHRPAPPYTDQPVARVEAFSYQRSGLSLLTPDS